MMGILDEPTAVTWSDLDATYALKPDNAARAVGQGELVINVRDFGAKGDGVTDDRAAIVAAMNAATAAGAGHTVFFPPGRYKIVGSLSMSGQTCTLQGAGASFAGSLGAGIGQGTALVGSEQTGPVVDFLGYVWPTNHRGRLSFGNFTVEGDGAADAAKTHSGIRMGDTNGFTDSAGGARFHDIVIAKTGGPCMDLNRVYLCDFERITVVTPVGAKANDVPYIIGRNVNANSFRRIGVRSITSSADCGASGAVIIKDDGTFPSYDNVFDAWWYEFLHLPTGGCLFKLRGNRNIVHDFSYSDITPESSSSDTAMIRLEPSTVDNFGGNIIRGNIPGTDGSARYTTYGVVVSQPRNRIEGIKGYKGKNVHLLAGSDHTTVVLGGAYSGATDQAVQNDSGAANHTIIDDFLRTTTRGTFCQDERSSRNGGAGPRFYDAATPANGAVWLGRSGPRVQAVGTSAFLTANTFFLRNTSLTNASMKLFFGGKSDPSIQAGTRSPEGVVTANPGSLFLRSDGGAGHTLYIKESGRGNTGWVAK